MQTMQTPTRPRRRRRRASMRLLDMASLLTAPAILALVLASWLLSDRTTREEASPSQADQVGLAAGAQSGAPASDGQITDAMRFSYGIGFDLGEKVRDGLRTDAQSADLEVVVRGFEDGLNSRPPAIPRAELDRVLRVVHHRLLQRAAEKRYQSDPEFKAVADRNSERSAEAIKVFAAEGSPKSIDGVLYRPLTDGPAEGPLVGDQPVVATYTIYGSDARTIDQRTEVVVDPAALLPAAAKVLAAMRPGDHWLIAIPPEKAFGLGGEPPEIGPNEVLLVDVSVRGIAPRNPNQAPGGGGR